MTRNNRNLTTSAVVDTDGDGLSDAVEIAGWNVSIYDVSGNQIAGRFNDNIISSNPYQVDTDGDGLTDYEEYLNSNPQVNDTDADGLTDYEEVKVWKTFPNYANSDHVEGRASIDGKYDLLSDGNEVLAKPGDIDLNNDGYKDNATSPLVSDSDFDGLVDGNSSEKQSLVSDLPSFAVNFGDSFTILLTKSITSADTTSTTNTETNTIQNTDSQTNTLVNSWSVGLGLKYSAKVSTTDLIFDKVEIGSELSFNTGYSGSATNSTTISNQKGYTNSFGNTVSNTETSSLTGADITTPVTFTNIGDRSFTLTKYDLNLKWVSPEGVTYNLGTDNDVFSGSSSLSQGTKISNDASFTIKDVDLIQQILLSPNNLYLEVGNVQYTDAFGINYAYIQENVLKNSAQVAIDFGSGNSLAQLVSTKTYGSLSFSDAVTAILGFDYTTDDDGSLSSLTDQDSKTYAETNIEQWIVIVNGKIYHNDVNDITLKPQDQLYLIYQIDKDGDGVSLTLELAANSDDTLVDTDNDGRNDYEEIFTGWTVKVQSDPNGKNFRSYQVFSSPILVDVDQDGVSDKQEYLAKTDPYLADTDGDGINDYDEINDGNNVTSPLNPYDVIDPDGNNYYIYVNTLNDVVNANDGLTSLREALTQAQNSNYDRAISFYLVNAGGDLTIDLNPSLGALSYSGNAHLTIEGPIINSYKSDGTVSTKLITIDGGRATNIMTLSNTNSVTISNLNFSNGKSSNNGGALSLLNVAELNLNNVTFENNETSKNGGAIYSQATTSTSGFNTTRNVIASDFPDASDVFAADFDGDLDIDVAALTGDYDKDDLMLYYNGDGSGTNWSNYKKLDDTADNDNGFGRVYGTDMNLDGSIDLLSSTNVDNDVVVFRNYGGSWNSQKLADNFGGASGIYAANLETKLENGNNYPDVIGISEDDDDLSIWLQTADNSFKSEKQLNDDIDEGIAVYATDFQGNGIIDVIAGGRGDDHYLKLYRNDGSATSWTSQTVDNNVSPYAIQTGDMDGDGDNDIVITDQKTSTIYWYQNLGNYSFSAKKSVYTVNGVFDVQLADLDADGDLDILAATLNNNSSVFWLKNKNGDGSSWTYTNVSNPSEVISSYVAFPADINGDGFLDVVSNSNNQDQVIWFKNNTSFSVKPEINLKDVTFKNNIAGINGGAIYNIGGTLSINNSEFEANKSSKGDGGALANYFNDSVTVKNSSFKKNTSGDAADDVGNDIYLYLPQDWYFDNNGSDLDVVYEPESHYPTHATVQNTLIANATVFRDLNGNNILDDDEPEITTDENGNFNYLLLGSNQEANLVAFGGIKDLTGEANILKFTAPGNARHITPFSTLMVAVEDQLTLSELQDKLNLSTDFNPLLVNTVVAYANTSGLEQDISEQYTLVDQYLGKLMDLGANALVNEGLAENTQQGGQLVIQSLAEEILSVDNSTTDLTGLQIVRSVFANTGLDNVTINSLVLEYQQTDWQGVLDDIVNAYRVELKIVPPKTVSGSPDADYFDSAFPDDQNFVGDKQILSTGSGNDTVDVSQQGEGNRIDTGSGDDIVFVGTNNRVNLGAGDDLLFGGYGNGGNTISGGTGADTFYLITDQEAIPSIINKISDFKASDDIIGFLNTELNLDNKGSLWNYEQRGKNVMISAFDQEIAQLSNTTITDANFVFG